MLEYFKSIVNSTVQVTLFFPLINQLKIKELKQKMTKTIPIVIS